MPNYQKLLSPPMTEKRWMRVAIYIHFHCSCKCTKKKPKVRHKQVTQVCNQYWTKLSISLRGRGRKHFSVTSNIWAGQEVHFWFYFEIIFGEWTKPTLIIFKLRSIIYNHIIFFALWIFKRVHLKINIGLIARVEKTPLALQS